MVYHKYRNRKNLKVRSHCSGRCIEDTKRKQNLPFVGNRYESMKTHCLRISYTLIINHPYTVISSVCKVLNCTKPFETYKLSAIYGPVSFTDECTAYAKRTQRTTKVSGLVTFVFIHFRNRQTVENWRKRNEKERSRVVCGSDMLFIYRANENNIIQFEVY